MRRSFARMLLLPAVAAACLAGEARAQNRDAAWEVFPYVGVVRPGSDSHIDNFLPTGEAAAIHLDSSASWGLRFGYHFTKQQMIEYAFGGNGTSGKASVIGTSTSKAADFNADTFTGQVNYVYNFFLHHRDKIVGYVTGGAGVLNFSTFGQSTDPDLQIALNKLVGDENDLLWDYGAGMRFFKGEKAGLRIDLRQVHYTSKGRGDLDYIEATVGLDHFLKGRLPGWAA